MAKIPTCYQVYGGAVDGSKDNCIANLKLAGLTADNTSNADSHKALGNSYRRENFNKEKYIYPF